MGLLDSVKKEFNTYWDDINKHSVVAGDVNSMMLKIMQAAHNGYDHCRFSREELPIYFKKVEIGGSCMMSDNEKEQREMRRNILINRFINEGFTVKEVTHGEYYLLTIRWV